MQINDAPRTITELALVTDAVEGQHEPLSTFELANHVLITRQQRKALAVRRDDHVYLLTPIVHRATCGGPLRGKVGRRSDHTCCHHQDGTFVAEALEQDVVQGLDLKLSATIAGVRACIQDRVNHRPENAITRQKIDALSKRRERL